MISGDRRFVLSAKGQRILAEVAPDSEALYAEIEKDFGNHKLEELYELLAEFTDSLAARARCPRQQHSSRVNRRWTLCGAAKERKNVVGTMVSPMMRCYVPYENIGAPKRIHSAHTWASPCGHATRVQIGNPADLSNRVAGLEIAALFSLVDHAESNSVFHRTARIHQLQLQKQFARAGIHVVSPEQRRTPDHLQDIAIDLHANCR